MASLPSRSADSEASLRRKPQPTASCRVLPRSNSSPTCNNRRPSPKRVPMLFVTRWFGVTGSDSERSLAQEQAELEELVEKVLLLQANSAAQQHRPIFRGTHAKGVCARAQFEVFDVTVGRDPGVAARLGEGGFAQTGGFPPVGGVWDSGP